MWYCRLRLQDTLNRDEPVRLLLILALGLLVTAMPVRADILGDILGGGQGTYQVAQQGGGMTLSQAIEQVRRQTGGKILSAETRREGNREVHHIKVLINDKQVRTFKIPGRTISR